MRVGPLWFLVALVVAGPLLGGCSTSSNFDPTDALDKLDFFNLNKEEKLKGERKALFPEGVPGVSQGIPQDLVKGNKPVETAAAPVVQEPPPEKPKPKPRVVNRAPPKTAAKPASKPMRVQVGPAEAAPAAKPQQAQQQAPAWPDSKPVQQQQTGAQSPWPAQQQQQTSPWPDAPPPNTFQR